MKPMPQTIDGEDSCASFVASVVWPRKTELVALAQRKTVPKLTAQATIAGTAHPACNAAAYNIHLLAKPLISGMPAMLPTPISHDNVVCGIFCARPPSLFMSRVPAACCTEPAVRNKPPLKKP